MMISVCENEPKSKETTANYFAFKDISGQFKSADVRIAR